MWPIYMDHVEIAGGKSNCIPLKFINGEWKFDVEELRAKLKRPQCKILLFNSPHNPTGKVFTLEEMQTISDILDECPHVIVLYDAVYENLVFDGHKHLYFGSIGNNWDRTISIFSGGKFFCATGWKVGWAIGPKKLIYFGGVIANTIYETFQTGAQVAMGRTLDIAHNTKNIEVENPKTGEKEMVTYAESMLRIFQINRDFMTNEFNKMDLPVTVLPSDSGYFVMLDITKCKDLVPAKYFETHDYEDPAMGPAVTKTIKNMPDGTVPLDMAFCRWFAIEYGVIMLPNSNFYGRDSTAETISYNHVRVAICKELAYLEGAIEKVKKFTK